MRAMLQMLLSLRPAFRNIPIKRKLVITFAVFFMIPFLLSSLVFYVISTGDITRRYGSFPENAEAVPEQRGGATAGER